MKKCMCAGVLVLMFIFLQGCGVTADAKRDSSGDFGLVAREQSDTKGKESVVGEVQPTEETEATEEKGSMCVHYTVEGVTKTAYTNARTVADFIKEIRIYFGEYDRLSVDKDSLVYDGLEFTITRVLIKTETETEAIEYDTITRETNDLGADETVVEIEGENGEYQHTYEVVYVDGEEESRTLLNEGYVKKPVTKVVLNGTGKSVDRVEYYGDTSEGGYRIVYYTDGTTKMVN